MRIPRSHSITFGLPSLRMYSAAISSSSSVADSPRLSSAGPPGAADLGEQRVVLHVARADLDHVGDLQHGVEVAHVHQLGDDRQARLGLRLGEQAQALLAEPLEGVGGGAGLVGAAAQQRRAGVAARRAPSAASARATRPCRGRRSSRSDRRRPCARRCRAPCARRGVICAEASLYGLRIGTTRSTPGWPSRPRLSTVTSCSTSPIAPITVTRAPRLRWASAPARSIFSTTASTSSSVAVSFITIIIDSSFQHPTPVGTAYRRRESSRRPTREDRAARATGLASGRAGPGWEGARSPARDPVRPSASPLTDGPRPKRLAKSPGVGDRTTMRREQAARRAAERL